MNESNGKITITKGALTALKDFEYMPLVIDIIFFYCCFMISLCLIVHNINRKGESRENKFREEIHI